MNKIKNMYTCFDFLVINFSNTFSNATKPPCRLDKNSFIQDTLPVARVIRNEVKCFVKPSTVVFLFRSYI